MVTTAASPIAMHSAASPDWGTPMLGKELAARVLAPAAAHLHIDLDYASSAYWHAHWPIPEMRPRAYLDGNKGRDVLNIANRRDVAGGLHCGAGFMNPPGLDGGEMVKKCWTVLAEDWRSGWLGSGVYVGFSLEQLASLQGAAAAIHPLSPGIVTIIPSRRGRYLLHPEALIALCLKKRKKRERASDVYKQLTRKIAELRARENDAPVVGDAPTHASFISILLSRGKATRNAQLDALRTFLREQEQIERSWFQRVAIVGADL